MGFLIPSALALTALALPIIIFYMLKLRRQPVRVSSLMLWQQVIQDRQANAPWQRLKRNLLLLLQLLILALLVMALARPYFTVAAKVQGNVVILLDASASMQATDVRPTRFAAAQAAALDVVNRLGPADAVTLIAVENTPRIVASTTADHAALRQSLAAARPSNGPADWPAALTLAAANAATLPDATIVVIGDGGIHEASDLTDESERLPQLPAPLEFILIGESAANQGIVALSLRDGAQGPELFVRVFNAAPDPARRLVEIEVDGQLFDARHLDLPAQDSLSLTLSGLPLNTHQVQARLSGQDVLAVDDTAWLVRNPAPLQLLIVGPGNLYLERALALLPGLTLQRAAPDQPLPDTRFDVVVFDRTDAAQVVTEGAALPEGNLLFIAPPVSTSLFEVTGVTTQTRLTRLATADPLLSYVKLNTMRVGRAQILEPPPWGRTLVEAEGGPLLVAGQTEKRRIAILTFDLHQSDLPLQIDFPILMVNLTRWLLPSSGAVSGAAQGQSLQAQQGFALPSATSADALLVNTPAGETVSLPPTQATFSETEDLGIYRIFAEEPGQENPTFLTEFVVNLLDETETNLKPQDAKRVATDGPTAAAPQALTGHWEWWGGLAVAGLVVLLVEWWVYWRGEVR